ncbi:hypothetical protein [Arthrobacter sp.]|uniref:hypothetical protein n=1 Tax=Arthrobacter sp. TaxID=1667 RepID=UPI003A8F94ED
MRRPLPPSSTLPRLLALAALGALSLAACSSGTGSGTSDTADATPATSSRSGSPAAGTAPATGSSPALPSGAASSAASPSGTPGTRGAAAGEEAIVPGAANEAWMKRARQSVVDTDPASTACLDTLLDQTMLDAVATHLPQVDSVVLGGQRHEAGCVFSAAGDPGTAPAVAVKRFYLANDTSKAMDETGLLGSDMCAPGREQDAAGISTEVDDVVVSRGPGGDVKATLRGAWSCSQDGKIGSAFLVSAGPGAKASIPDPNQLALPDFAVAAATHLHDTEVNWAPTLDDLHETYFRDIAGQ